MTPSEAPVPIENDPRNPCVGCGPENPIGLHLEFARVGDAVSTSLRAKPTYQGWPGRLHLGILYIAMLETANWAVFAARGRIGVPSRTGALVSKRWVEIGEELRLVGRLVTIPSPSLRIAVSASDKGGEEVAFLDREYS